MKNIVLIVCMFVANICASQEGVGIYDFIEVPDRFEFISKDNPHQMSDMMVFYLEKKGLKTYRKIDSPNVPKCDALYGDIMRVSNLLTTKLIFVLKDCNDRIVFQSREGRSKVKDYAKAYPDALRMAFKTFSKKDVNISEVPEAPIVVINEENVETIKSSVVKTTDAIKEVSKLAVTEDAVNVAINQMPEASFSNYKLKENTYLLKKVATGFTLFLVQEGSENFIKVGELKMDKEASFMMVDIYGETKPGYFNEKQDLVIQLSNGSELIYTKEI